MAYLNGERSKFPEKVDLFSESFDLTYDKLAKANRLQELVSKSGALSTTEQQEIKQLQTELKDNQITAESWNKLGDAIFNLQTFFTNEVKGYIESKQSEWAKYVKDFMYTGTWTSGKTYKAQNMVTLANGDLFIAKVDHTSSSANQPSKESNAYWGFIGTKGDKGDPSLTTKYLGNWVNTKQYVVGDSVTYVHEGAIGGIVYVSKTTNTGKQPNISPNDWQILTDVYAGTKTPTQAQAGQHFIQLK